MRTLATIAIALGFFGTACGEAAPVAPPPAVPTPAPAPTAEAPVDPLGPRPVPAPAPAYLPPAPTVYTTANGMTVWLLERHTLPIVAVTVTIPTGGASDPKGQAGLARGAADMLDEGAGKRGALDYAKAVDDLGARISAGASIDRSFVQLDVTKRGFSAGMQLLGDAVVRPRFEAKEWKRVHDLWMNSLKQRASEPRDVARVVEMVTLYGADHPYGHPVDGTLSTVPKVTLDGAKKFRDAAWRPDRATVVVVGDVTKGELDAQLDAAFGAWKAPKAAPMPIVTPPAPAVDSGGAQKTKIVMVDRKESSQAVVALVRPGIAESDPREPALERVNIALGGSFDSRLMQDLREKHGWTYGVGSSIVAMRGVGSIIAGGSFVTDKTADALKEMYVDVDAFAQSGITDEEAAKTQLQMRADLVDEYQTIEHVSLALAHDAALGLGPDWEAKAAAIADQADAHTLNTLAQTFYDRAGATVVIVGSRAKLEGPLNDAGLGPIVFVDAEGHPVTAPVANGTAASSPKAVAPHTPVAPTKVY
jgi:zinc protease